MKKVLVILILVLNYQLYSQSIKDLDFLIGKWEVTETVYPGTDKSWNEDGVRECQYYLKDAFIKCESLTIDSRNQKERAYAYIFNYDKKEGCFQVTSLAHDFPLHGKHKWFLDKDKKLIQAITPKSVRDDRFFRATIDFSDPDKVVWNAWRSIFDQDKEWFQVFNDVAVRKEN